MFYNYYQSNEYQYDSCVTKGVCSTDPTTTSLQEVIVMYLKQLAHYLLELKEAGISNEKIKSDILNILSGLVSNPDYSQEQFQAIITRLYSDVSQAKALYKKLYVEKNTSQKELINALRITKKFNLAQAIRQGEREFSERTRKLSPPQKSLYEIMFLLIKSVCINLIELESFGRNYDAAYRGVLELLDSMNNESFSIDELKEKIENFAKIDGSLIRQLNEAKRDTYGEQGEVEVSYSSRKGKCILVSGTNLKELEEVLKATDGKEIDVYTHGEMIMGHTYPRLREHAQLRGQFGWGIENCLLDYATFPGAILITKHSIQNIEYLYRGRLFTSDTITPRGVVKIENNDYTKLITSALDAKGFSKGRERESLKIGYSEEIVLQQVDRLTERIEAGEVKHIYLVGLMNYTNSLKDYFERFYKQLGINDFVISFSYPNEGQNAINILSLYDFSLAYKILERIVAKISLDKFPITVFVTKCDKHTISHILALQDLGIKQIFLSKCPPSFINPSLLNFFCKAFGISKTTNPKDDYNKISNLA